MSNPNKIDAPAAPGELVKAMVAVSYELEMLTSAIKDIRFAIEGGDPAKAVRYRMIATTLNASMLVGRLIQMQVILAGED